MPDNHRINSEMLPVSAVQPPKVINGDDWRDSEGNYHPMTEGMRELLRALEDAASHASEALSESVGEPEAVE